MEVIESKLIGEKEYIETLENGMEIIIIPKHQTNKKYIIWGTKFGSIDNHFIEPITNKEIKVPDGVAHYLEHKMFEQKSGVDSLYTLMALGLDANAYTTNDHTAYLFGGVDNFYKGLDELMDYVQNPYFTDQNVEKERGIIGQEIGRYDDEPAWKVYLNAMKCLYTNNPIRIDIAGTVETISHITKETLYSCYNTFYHPSNMIMCIAGDFEPEKIVEEVRKRLLPREPIETIKRIYEKEPNHINQKQMTADMNVNMPLFMIGYRDYLKDEDSTQKDIALKIIFNSLLGKCSKAYTELYEKNLLMSELSFDYEFSDIYSHVLFSGESLEPEKVYEKVTNVLRNEEISKDDFERSKKRIFGEFVTIFDDVEEIGRTFLSDEMHHINTIETAEKIKNINYEYVKSIQKKMFDNDESIISIVK